MHKNDNGINFVIFNWINYTGKVHKLKEILCVRSVIEELDVSAYVGTNLFRENRDLS